MFIVYGGLGMQGKAIVQYLEDQTTDQIVVFDQLESPDEALALYHEDRVTYVCTHRDKEGEFFKLGQFISNITLEDEKERVVVISCLPSGLNYRLTKLCINLKVDMIDLGGDSEIVLAQHRLDGLAREAGITIIPDCGIAPGLVSSYAGNYADREDVSEFHAYCGGIPKHPTNLPLGYSRVFAAQGVIKEYSGLALEIRNGTVTRIPTLSEKELVHVPGFGVLEANVTSGGTSITPLALEGKLDRFSYKTLRYPGHWDYVKENIMSQSNPEKVLSGMLKDADEQSPDVIILSMKAILTDGSEEYMDLLWEYEDGLSAMAKATGYPAASVACMISDGVCRDGVVGLHEVDITEIEDRSVSIYCDKANFSEL